jgi:hypothetical protein
VSRVTLPAYLSPSLPPFPAMAAAVVMSSRTCKTNSKNLEHLLYKVSTLRMSRDETNSELSLVGRVHWVTSHSHKRAPLHSHVLATAYVPPTLSV